MTIGPTAGFLMSFYILRPFRLYQRADSWWQPNYILLSSLDYIGLGTSGNSFDLSGLK